MRKRRRRRNEGKEEKEGRLREGKYKEVEEEE